MTAQHDQRSEWPDIKLFLGETARTISYVVSDPQTRRAAIVDPVLDLDDGSGQVSARAVERILGYVDAEHLALDLVLETGAHAGHLSAAPYIAERSGAVVATGGNVLGRLGGDRSRFDLLLEDGETFAVGGIEGRAVAGPRHRPECMVWVIGDVAFVGCTPCLPDPTTVPCVSPRDAAEAACSIRRVFVLPTAAALFLRHERGGPGRDEYVWEQTVATLDAIRDPRRVGAAKPRLILPSVPADAPAGAQGAGRPARRPGLQ